jgi:tetratricopeptide (TPR) repeat protein
MRLRLAVAVVALLAAVGCAGDSAPETDREIPALDTSEMQAPVRRALDAARAAVVASPEDPDAWGEYGQVLFAHKLYEPAAICFGHARELFPHFRSAYLLALSEDLRGADDDRVVGLFRDAEALQSSGSGSKASYPPLYQRYGDALVRLGRLDEAGEAYRTALETDPDLAISHRSLGQTLLQAGRLAEAIEHLERAAALRGEDSIVHATLAQAYTRAGDPERAAEHVSLAGQYEALNRFPDLIGYEVEALAVDSESLRARSNEKFAAGRYAEAIPDLEMLIETATDSAPTRARLGSAYNRSGRAVEAIEQLTEAVRLEPRMINGLLLLATVRYDTGELDRAREHYAAALEVNPEHEGIFSKRALAMAIQGDMAGADSEFARHAALTETDAEVEHNWGTVLMRKGEPAAAEGHFRRALELRPGHAESAFNLGLTLGSLGRIDEAIAVLEGIVAADNGDGGRATMLADAARQKIDELRYGSSGP